MCAGHARIKCISLPSGDFLSVYLWSDHAISALVEDAPAPLWLQYYICKAPLNVCRMKRTLYKCGIIIINHITKRLKWSFPSVKCNLAVNDVRYFTIFIETIKKFIMGILNGKKQCHVIKYYSLHYYFYS